MTFEELQKLALERIERDISAIKEKLRKNELTEDYVADVISNIRFATQLNIFSTALANELKQKLQSALADFRKLERFETRDVVNDYENPREIARKYYNMETYNSQIAKQRELEHLKSVNDSEHSQDKER